MYTEVTPTSCRKPEKVIKDSRTGREIRIFKRKGGFDASHSYYPHKRWQKYQKDLSRLVYICRQELNRVRNAEVRQNNFSAEDYCDLEYLKRIASGIPLRTLGDEWLTFKKRFSVKEISIDEAVSLYLEKYRENRTKQYIQSSSVYVKKLARYASGRMLVDVANVDFIEEYGRTLKGRRRQPDGTYTECEPSGSQKKQNRFHLKRFFEYMQVKGYLPESLRDVTRVLDVKRTDTAVYFITPKEANDFVLNTPIELIPYVILGKIVGVRPEEGVYDDEEQAKNNPQAGLLWEDFKFNERRIILRRSMTKLPRDRVIPMDDLLYDLLSIFDGMTGPVHPLDIQKKLKKTLLNKSGWSWVRNGIRHSCATMRIQRGDDRSRILSEMQTGDDMLKNHYDESAKAFPNDYLKWFGILIPTDHQWGTNKRIRGFIPEWNKKITPEFIERFNEHMHKVAAKYPIILTP